MSGRKGHLRHVYAWSHERPFHVRSNLVHHDNSAQIAQTFTRGKVYQISNVSAKYRMNVGDSVTFRYVGTSGELHVFEAVKGGWTISLHNNQLIGKKVKEVGEDKKGANNDESKNSRQAGIDKTQNGVPREHEKRKERLRRSGC